MEGGRDLPRDFSATETLNLDIKNNLIVQFGQIKGSSDQAIVISRPKIPSQLTFQSIQSQTLTFSNDIYNNYSVVIPTQWELKFMCPSTQKQYKKYKKKTKQLRKQTPQQYLLKDLSKEIVHNKWVYNILDGLAEAERIAYRQQGEQGFILIPDSEYLDKEKDEMHYLGIVNDRTLYSIRDLNSTHVNMLKDMQVRMREVLQKQLGEESTYREYFHYPPTFYHLHIHFSSLEIQGPTVQIQRCHELSQVIRNLELDGEYYKNATLNVLQDKPL